MWKEKFNEIHHTLMGHVTFTVKGEELIKAMVT